MLVILPVLLYSIAQVGAVLSLRGKARFLAAFPALPMAWITYVTVGAYRQQSNLWPILLIFACPFAALFIAVVWAVGRKRNDAVRGA